MPFVDDLVEAMLGTQRARGMGGSLRATPMGALSGPPRSMASMASPLGMGAPVPGEMERFPRIIDGPAPGAPSTPPAPGAVNRGDENQQFLLEALIRAMIERGNLPGPMASGPMGPVGRLERFIP